jgi:hypothetical protein
MPGHAAVIHVCCQTVVVTRFSVFTPDLSGTWSCLDLLVLGEYLYVLKAIFFAKTNPVV